MSHVMHSRDFLPSADQIRGHVRKCKICTLEDDKLKHEINGMLLRDCTDGDIARLGEKHGVTITATSVSAHRKYLPFTISDDHVRDILDKSRKNAMADIPATRVFDMEARVAEVRLKVAQAQEDIKQNIWDSAVPALINRITSEAQAGVVPVRDLAYALDLIMKNGMLLQGKPTEIHEVNSINQKQVEGVLVSDEQSAELLKDLYRRKTELDRSSQT
jgi:hypothetical protein